jgi:hypothetical protein
MVVTSHRPRRRPCQTRPARQHTHHTQTCTVAVAHGDVAATSMNRTMALHPSAASKPVLDPLEPAVIHQTHNRRRRMSSSGSAHGHGTCSTRDTQLDPFPVTCQQHVIIPSTAFSGVRKLSFVTTTPSLDLFCSDTFGQFPRATHYYPYCTICEPAYADLYIL